MHAAMLHDTGPVGCRSAACVWTWVFNHAHHHSWLPTCGRGPAAANPDSQGLLHEPAVELTGTSSIITVNSTTTDAKSDVLYEEGDPAEAALAEKRDGIIAHDASKSGNRQHDRQHGGDYHCPVGTAPDLLPAADTEEHETFTEVMAGFLETMFRNAYRMNIISRKGMTIAEYDEALEDGVEAVFDTRRILAEASGADGVQDITDLYRVVEVARPSTRTSAGCAPRVGCCAIRRCSAMSRAFE